MMFFLPYKYIKSFVYGVFSRNDLEDPWCAESLKTFDVALYRELNEYTKGGANTYELEEILNELSETDRNFVPDLDTHETFALEYATKKVLGYMQAVVGKVEPWSIERSVESLHNDTSAGAGYLGKKKGEVKGSILEQAKMMFWKAVDGVPVLAVATMVGTRAHMHKLTNKARRMIFNVPAAQIALELCYVKPITDKLLEKPDSSLMFFGKNVIGRLALLMRRAFGRKSAAVRLDFKKFDRTVPTFLLRRAFGIVRELIDFEHWEGKSLSPSEVQRQKRVFDMVEEYFVNTPVMSPKGNLIIIEGMIISGSGFTQLIGSIVTAILVEMAAQYDGIGVMLLRTLGDDGYAGLAQYPDLEKWAKYFMRWFRMELSVEKSKVFNGTSNEKNFLGYVFKHGFLVRKSFDLFNLFLHPGGEVDSLQKSYTRLTAYMFLGGVSDLKFCKFYEYYQSCYDLDDSWEFQDDWEMKSKRDYAGQNIPIKRLNQYTFKDFLYGLTAIK
jgi:hypothetical protein